MSDNTHSPPSILPAPRPIDTGDVLDALRKGVRDFTRAPLFGIAFSAVYVLGGIVLYSIFLASGQSWWFAPVAVGFPLLAPFAAIGLYEVSRRLERDQPLDWAGVAGCILAQRERQIPSMAMVILLVFMFWVFVAHTIFALFFGMQPITSSTADMLMSPSGLMMLLVGTVIGGVMAAALFALTVISLPLLLDRELDFVTAMITSVSVVQISPKAMAIWAVIIAAVLFLAMLPLFLGLFVALPVLGHATWHIYRKALP